MSFIWSFHRHQNQYEMEISTSHHSHEAAYLWENYLIGTVETFLLPSIQGYFKVGTTDCDRASSEYNVEVM